MVDNKSRIPAMGLLKTLDVTLVLLSFVLTTLIIIHAQSSLSLAQFLSIRVKISNFVIFTFGLLLCHIVFAVCGMYRSRRLSSQTAEILDMLKATTLLMACFSGIAVAFSVRMITGKFLGVLWVVSAAVLCASRIVLRFGLARARMRGRNLRFILILGTNRRAVGFARRIESSQELGYRIIGFVDDFWSDLATFSESGFPLVSDYKGLPEFLRRNVVDEVAIFLPVGSFYKHSADVVGLCKQHGIIMRFNSNVFDLKTTKCHAEEFAGDYYIVSGAGPVAGWRHVVKRGVDMLLAISAILVLSPLLLAVALAIKLSSGGPVFFLQERLGVAKRRFNIIKFRTMVPNAEQLMGEVKHRNEASGPVFKIVNDPRITPLGKFLRRSSIDELPQLFNVLKGDMSLVGPRPLPVRDYEGFSEDWQRRRFSVKPGITCLWQVNGRSTISFHDWMLLDLQYMDEWSLWLDFKILVRTVPAVLRGSGAV